MPSQETKPRKKPWPTKDAMQQIYNRNLWGGADSEYYSGIGSHDPDYVEPYLQALSAFLSSFEDPLVVCDLGCGDFNVGKELIGYTKKYIAVDIVDELIEHNREKFTDERLQFDCKDIASDTLPQGDCAILRQVLQHLSNAEVKKVVNKLNAFNYLIVTEHIPEGEFTPNKEIISGQGIRLKKQSGVDLLAPPFNLMVQDSKEMLTVPYKEGKGVVVTTLYKTSSSIR